ncbi:MAG: chalcone isomerase family protein [Nitrosomonadales bacterium]|nr:chalcone isomerase family protein [Nitrosomonadales bacterium]
MRKLIALFLLCLSAQTFAIEVAGVRLDDKAQVGNAALQLNGAGIRTKLIFKVYVGALYLGGKKHNAAAVLADAGAKRVTLHMLRELSSEKLLEAFDKGLAANNTAAELSALDARIKEFSAIFRLVNEVAKGDVIVIDYLPGEGTRVSVNGAEKGRVAGAEFNRALLKVWLGDEPVDEDLKKGMLGE